LRAALRDAAGAPAGAGFARGTRVALGGGATARQPPIAGGDVMRGSRGAVWALAAGLLLAAATGWAAAGKIDVNTASAQELATLPGVGPAKAQAIIEHREKKRFAKPDDLREVKGIGDKLYEKLRDQITVGDAPAASPGRGG
jgi:competence protein ComEA